MELGPLVPMPRSMSAKVAAEIFPSGRNSSVEGLRLRSVGTDMVAWTLARMALAVAVGRRLDAVVVAVVVDPLEFAFLEAAEDALLLLLVEVVGPVDLAAVKGVGDVDLEPEAFLWSDFPGSLLLAGMGGGAVNFGLVKMASRE